MGTIKLHLQQVSRRHEATLFVVTEYSLTPCLVGLQEPVIPQCAVNNLIPAGSLAPGNCTQVTGCDAAAAAAADDDDDIHW